MLKLTTDKHDGSRGLSATAELLVVIATGQPIKFPIYYTKIVCQETPTSNNTVRQC